MADLWYREGQDPAPLPFQATTPDGDIRTDLPNHPDSAIECGFVRAPPQPDYDAATQALRWNRLSLAWEVYDLPPPEPPPPPPPVVLTIGQFTARFIVPDEDEAFAELDDAMLADSSRIVRKNWVNPAYSFKEGDGFWTKLKGYLEAVVTAERAAELLGRYDPIAAAATPAGETDAA